MKVLIVDDDNNILSMLTSFLSKVGWTVASARGPEEALGLLDDTVDVAVSDLRMDNQSGVDLLLEIRRCFPCLEVILMSGYDEAGDLAEQAGIQVFAFLKKPFDLGEFNRLLLAAIRSRDKSLMEICIRDRLKNEVCHSTDVSNRTGQSGHYQNLDLLPLPLMTLNADFEITGCNAAAAVLFGRTQEAMTGRPLSSLVCGSLERLSPVQLQEEHGTPCADAAGLCVESGRETLFLFPENPAGLTLRGMLRRIEPPAENAFILMIEDFTEQNEAAFRREIATRKIVMAEIASMLSHEINQPLNAIASYVQLIKYRLDSGRGMAAEELGQMCQEMLNEIGRLNDLVQSARNSSALKREQASPRTLDLRAHYYFSTRLVRGLIYHRDIELEENFPAGLPPLSADPLRIGKVFECLLLNAMESIISYRASGSGAPGLIRVSAFCTDMDGRAGVRFQVWDSGSGIRTETRGQVLEPLFPGADNASPPGIDLTVAHAILRGLEGGLKVETIAEGGCCLSFWLPEAGKNE